MDDRTKQLITLGREHYTRGEFDKAEHYFKQVLERHVSAADVFNMLGVIYHDRGHFENAQAAFEEALEINPAYTYNDLGRYEDAKRVYRAALAQGAKAAGGVTPFVKGKIANLHADVAQAYVDAGMMSEAMHELRKAVLLCPDFADLRLKLANLYRETADYEAAAYELEEAIKVKPLYVVGRGALFVGRRARRHAVLATGPRNRSAKSPGRALLEDGEEPAHGAASAITNHLEDDLALPPHHHLTPEPLVPAPSEGAQRLLFTPTRLFEQFTSA
jgi:tetratricopeptide (TPR) repeat protein